MGMMTTTTDTTRTAQKLLFEFGQFTTYRHGVNNPFLKHLRDIDRLGPQQVIDFLNVWYSFSRRTPQILLRVAAAYPSQHDRRLIFQNYVEEDGMKEAHHAPHYDLLEALVYKLGGVVERHQDAESLIEEFMDALGVMDPPTATGVLSGFEHPALDITEILMRVVTLGGRPDLLETDAYLGIHVAVEPDHIVWAHGTAFEYMKRGHGLAVVGAFRRTMGFWSRFWTLAMAQVGYRASE